MNALESDGALFRALLDIIYFGQQFSIRLEHRGTHADYDVIVIGDREYITDNADDRRKLIEYADRLRHREANASIEPLP